jgi:hypothetical protein
MQGIWLLIYVSGMMFVMRHFAGPIAHKLSPVGLLWLSSLLASTGLVLLSIANSPITALLAATDWGTGVCYMWPTMLAASLVLAVLVRAEYVAHHEWLLFKRLATRALVAVAARVGARSLACDLPPRDQLAAWPHVEVWEQFREQVESCAISRLEVLAGRGTRLSWNDVCGTQSAVTDADHAWVLQLNFRARDGGWCRMHVHVTDQAPSHPWAWLELLAALRHFGRLWAERPERPTPAVTPLVREERRAA